MSILSHFSQLTQAPTRDRLPNFGENRIQGLSTIQAPTPSTSIMSLVTTGLNFVIFILSSLSLIVGALSLVLAIIFSIQKSKNANICWIIFGVCGAIILFSIVLFAIVSLFINTAGTVNLSSGI